MKRIMIIACLGLVLAPALTATSITVSRPLRGDQWIYETEHDVTWRCSGSVGRTVRIELIREGETHPTLNLALETDNDNSFTLNVPISPGGFPAPGRYFVRVTTPDGSIHGDSGVITIRHLRPRVIVTCPNDGETVTLNTNQPIRWTPVELSPGAKVDIDLLRRGVVVTQIIRGNNASIGHALWPVSDTIEPGSNYRIRISLRDADSYDESNRRFTIAAPTASGDLEFVALSGEEGRVKAHIRSTFPSLNKNIICTLYRPDAVRDQRKRINHNMQFTAPGERAFTLEFTLPQDINRHNSQFTYYTVNLDVDNTLDETNERNNSKSAQLPGYPFYPVIEKVVFDNQEARRGRTVRWRNSAWSGAGYGKMHAPVNVWIRSDGFESSGTGTLRISQAGHLPEHDVDGNSGGTMLVDTVRVIGNFPHETIGRTAVHLSKPCIFYMYPTDLVVEFVPDGGAPASSQAVFRFPLDFSVIHWDD